MTRENLEQEIRELRAQLAESQETLRAIREGEVDALVVSTPAGQRIFTLQGADHTYQTIVEQMYEGAVTLAVGGRISYSNRRFAEMVKRPLEQIIGSHFCEHVVESNHQDSEQLICRSHGGSTRGEMSLRAADGTRIPVRVSMSGTILEGTASVCAVVSDLTESKRAQAVLASEQEYRSLAESIPHMVWSARPDGASDYCNLRFLNYLGRTPDQIQGWDWVSTLHPDDRQPSVEAWTQALAAGAEYRVEHRIRRAADGKYRWHASHAVPLRNDEGRIVRWFGTSTDVHDQKLTEDALRASESRFRNVFDHAATGIGITDCLGRFDLCNAAYCELTGYSLPELTTMEFSTLIHPDDREENIRRFRKLMDGEIASFEIENRYVRKDASFVWVHKHVSLLHDDRGQPTHIIALVTDMTMRRQTEDVLRFLAQCGTSGSGEGFFHELARYLAQALDMEFVCIDTLEDDQLSAQTLAVFHDGQFQDNVSYTLRDTPCGDVVGKQICRFPRNVRKLFPKDEVLQDLQAESYLGTTLWSAQGKPIGLIAVIGRQPLADTRSAEAILQLVAVRAAGELERRQADQKLRESEALYRAIGESIDYGVWVCDVNGRNIYASESLLKLVGLTQDQCSNFGWGDVLHPDDAERTLAAWKECVCTGRIWDIEHRYRGHDGQWHPILARGVPVRNEQGQVTCWVGINLDISSLKQAEEHIRASLAEKEVLLKEIHHRVKNNMQVISSLVTLQAERSSEPAIRTVLQDVTHRVRSMALVHEKLYQSADMARVEFAEYVRSLLSYLWRAHGNTTSGIQLTTDLAPVALSINAAVPCGLLLNELVSNALRHAFRHCAGGEVAVSLRGDPEGQVCLCVRDNGAGLPAGLDWRQVDSLGLRLVQLLAGQLHATVEVSCDYGTAFTVVFGGPKA